jgi:hypothetical protein
MFITLGMPVPPQQQNKKAGNDKPPAGVAPEGVFLDEVHDDIVKNLQNESIADPDPSVGKYFIFN